jgi:hypothetical protein
MLLYFCSVHLIMTDKKYLTILGHGYVTKHPKTSRNQIVATFVSILLQKMVIGSLQIKPVSPKGDIKTQNFSMEPKPDINEHK